MTDIQGATKAWDSTPIAMRHSIIEHDRILMSHIARHRGHVIESGREGDSVLATFQRPQDAIAAALDIQRNLLRQSWPVGISIRVRMALHTGEAELIHGHYVGVALYRCARLLATAHGGQVVISAATAQLVEGQLPADASVQELGHFALRDFRLPERIHQVVHPDLPAEFPPLRAIATSPLAHTPQQ